MNIENKNVCEAVSVTPPVFKWRVEFSNPRESTIYLKKVSCPTLDCVWSFADKGHIPIPAKGTIVMPLNISIQLLKMDTPESLMLMVEYEDEKVDVFHLPVDI